MTYYDILGVPQTASKDEIKKAYRKLAQDYHPDQLAGIPPAVLKLAEEKFKDVQEAYEILTQHRAEYDNQLRAVAPPPPPPPPPPQPKAPTAASAPLPSQPAGRTSTSAPPSTVPSTPRQVPTNKKNIWYVCGNFFGEFPWWVAIVFLLIVGAILRLSNSPEAPKQAPMTVTQPSSTPKVAETKPIFAGQQKTADSEAMNPTPSGPSAKFTEQFGGIVHNQLYNLSAELEIVVQDTGGILSGCVGVKQPLFGSGPLSGRVAGSEVSFVVTSAVGKITFVGRRRSDAISGKYRVERDSRPTELGTFTLARVKSDGPWSNYVPQNCPTDPEVQLQKTTNNSVIPNPIPVPTPKDPMSLPEAVPNALTNKSENAQASLPGQQSGTVANAAGLLWNNLKDGYTYRILPFGDNLTLESVETDPADLAAIVRCQFKRAISVGIIWIGTCQKRNLKYRNESRSNATVTLFSDSRIEGSDFVLIPNGTMSSEDSAPKPAVQQIPPTRLGLPALSVAEQQSTAMRSLDLSGLNTSERQSIESACLHPKLVEGPAAYNRCLVYQLGLLMNQSP